MNGTTLEFAVIVEKLTDLREKTGKMEEVLEHLRGKMSGEYEYKVSEIEWFIMMLKQRFDNVEMLALGIDCCEDDDEEMDFMNSLDYQAAIADDNIYSLDLVVV